MDVREQLVQELNRLHYRPKTIVAYLLHFDQLKAFYPSKTIEEISQQDIWQYLKFLIERKQASAQTAHQAVYAFIFAFNTILKSGYDLRSFPLPKRTAEVPEILTPDEVRLVLQNASTLKHRTVFALIYSAGLDTGEAASIRLADVDTKNRVLTVRTPAGKIARKSILSEYIIHLLEDYLEEYKPKKWLFEGQNRDSHYATDTIQKSFRKIKDSAGIIRNVSVRSLRYSYIKHLEQQGVPLTSVLRALGMFTKDTVWFYSQIEPEAISVEHSPLDALMYGETKAVKRLRQNARKTYVDPSRIAELQKISSKRFDLSKLVELCRELNRCYDSDDECFLAVVMLSRAILDHVPPVFGCSSFSEVANNYAGPKSFKQSMQHLDNSLRKIADAHLHVQIREKESLPNRTQVDFSSDMDVLLAEVVRILK